MRHFTRASRRRDDREAKGKDIRERPYVAFCKGRDAQISCEDRSAGFLRGCHAWKEEKGDREWEKRLAFWNMRENAGR